MRSVKFLFGFALAIALPTLGMSQRRQITQSQFDDALNSGILATNKVFPRRETESKELLLKGKLEIIRKVVTDIFSPDTIHIIKTDIDLGVSTTWEMIQLRKDYYCRTGNDKWKKQNVQCGITSMSGRPSAQSSSFSAETIKEGDNVVQTYSAYSVSKPLENVDKYLVQFFSEETLWLNSDGTLQKLVHRGGDEVSKIATSRDTTIFEYSIALQKIVTPN